MRSKWFEGFLVAEEIIKSGVSRVSIECGHITFHFPEGGSSGFSGENGPYFRGLKDYVKQYETVIKEVLEG